MTPFPPLKLGQRVQLSEQARIRKLSTRHFGKTGTVVGRGNDGSVRVQWDGIRTAYNYHPAFLRSA